MKWLLVLVLSNLCRAWSPSNQRQHKHDLARLEVSARPLKMAPSESMEPPPVFPMSTRSALIEKAKELDENLAQGEKRGGYSSVGWSNRLGTVLTPASIPGVYTGDREFIWNSIDVSCRMVVIQLEDGGLWVHSPVGLDAPLKQALDKLGKVKYVVSPNYEHLKFAPQWAREYPDANMWGCPGLAERMPEISFAGEIPERIRPSSWKKTDQEDCVLANEVQLENCWDLEEIQPLHIDVEVNPATGKPFFNEVIFYHKPSQTLITTDLYWNYPQPDGVPNSHLSKAPVYSWELAPSLDSIPLGSRAFFFAMNRLYLPLYKKIMVQDKSAFQKIVNFIIEEWDATTLIPAHGDLVRGRSVIQDVLRQRLRV